MSTVELKFLRLKNMKKTMMKIVQPPDNNFYNYRGFKLCIIRRKEWFVRKTILCIWLCVLTPIRPSYQLITKICYIA